MYKLSDLMVYSAEELLSVATTHSLNVDKNAKKADIQKSVISLLCAKKLVSDDLGLGLYSAKDDDETDLVRDRDIIVEREKDRQLERERMAQSDREMAHEERIERERMEHQERLMELEFKKLEAQAKLQKEASSPKIYSRSTAATILPNFNERAAEYFFEQFEKLAVLNDWPTSEYVNLIQFKLVGRAKDVFISLSIDDLTNYDTVKSKILDAYHITAEKLRQNFRSITKNGGESYLEFINRKSRAFDKWLREAKVDTFNSLKNLILSEEFFQYVPEDIKLYLIDKLDCQCNDLAKLADSYDLSIKQSKSGSKPALFHKKSSPPVRIQDKNFNRNFSEKKEQSTPKATPPQREFSSSSPSKFSRFCSYCKNSGHTYDFCWKRKDHYRFSNNNNAVQNINSFFDSRRNHSVNSPTESELKPNASEFQPKVSTSASSNAALNIKINYPELGRDNILKFHPFVCESFISSVDGADRIRLPVKCLRDTGCSISLVKRNVLPSSFLKCLEGYALITGVGSSQSIPLYYINLNSPFGYDKILVGLVDDLPVAGIDVLLGNDYLGSRVKPEDPVDVTKNGNKNFNNVNNPVVMCSPCSEVKNDEFSEFIYPECVVTRAQSKKCGADSLLQSLSPDNSFNCDVNLCDTFFADLDVSDEKVSVNKLIELQKSDSSLAMVRKDALNINEIENEDICYYYKNDLLMRKWTPASSAPSNTWSVRHQIIVPESYRKHILRLAHDTPLGGHLGVSKTLDRIRGYFYWPGVQKDCSYYCKTCETCQRVGKPNQTIPVSPLIPIPVLDPPFTRVLCDVVGPLPSTSSGNRYILTLLDVSTRYPEAFCLKEVSAPTVADCFIKFFAQFGICKEIQTDQGSNFMSNLITELCNRLQIKKIVASPYHPQSQGALERYHQTLKSMIRCYCEENSSDWDRGIPLLLFATREVPVESLGFSPFELVYGHSVRGPLKLLQESFLGDDHTPISVSNYVSEFQERLIESLNSAHEKLRSSQAKMKTWYDKRSRERKFVVGDKVLVLLPIFGQPLKSKFCGPYDVIKKLSDVNYVISTPDRRKNSRVCHVNMLKLFHQRSDDFICCFSDEIIDEQDCFNNDVDFRNKNFESLNNIDDQLQHLDFDKREQMKSLIHEFKDIFSDLPGLTDKIVHDIDVGDSAPIRQAPYRLNPKKIEIVKSEIESMLEADIIEPSSSPYSSPIIVLTKEDGSARICVDLRKVNDVSKSDSYPLPRIDDLIDKIGSAKYLSKFDARKGYFQVKLTDRAKLATAFATPFGLFQFKRMCYGVKGGPATFQRLMNNLLGHCSSFIIVYIDDVCVFSNTWEDHILHVRILFEIMRDAHLTLKLDKSVFANAEITFLGFKIGLGRLLPKDKNIQAIKQYSVPSCKRDIQRFLGVVGYFRRFVPNFATIAEPLTNLLHKNVKFCWTEPCEVAFNNLKLILCNPPILALPNFQKDFKLAIDASGVGIGAVLFQSDDNDIDHPLSYYSKKLNSHQKNYSTIEKEAFALISAVKHFSIYLECSATLVYTDHNPLTFIHKFKSQNAKLLRWFIFLQPFNLKIVHISGKRNLIADALSRAPSP